MDSVTRQDVADLFDWLVGAYGGRFGFDINVQGDAWLKGLAMNAVTREAMERGIAFTERSGAERPPTLPQFIHACKSRPVNPAPHSATTTPAPPHDAIRATWVALRQFEIEHKYPTTGGKVIDPAYMPEGRRDPYLAAIRTWRDSLSPEDAARYERLLSRFRGRFAIKTHRFTARI